MSGAIPFTLLRNLVLSGFSGIIRQYVKHHIICKCCHKGRLLGIGSSSVPTLNVLIVMHRPLAFSNVLQFLEGEEQAQVCKKTCINRIFQQIKKEAARAKTYLDKLSGVRWVHSVVSGTRRHQNRRIVGVLVNI